MWPLDPNFKLRRICLKHVWLCFVEGHQCCGSFFLTRGLHLEGHLPMWLTLCDILVSGDWTFGNRDYTVLHPPFVTNAVSVHTWIVLPPRKTRTLCHWHWFHPHNIGILGSLLFEASNSKCFMFYPNTHVRIRGCICHINFLHRGHIYTFFHHFQPLSQTSG